MAFRATYSYRTQKTLCLSTRSSIGISDFEKFTEPQHWLSFFFELCGPRVNQHDLGVTSIRLF